MPSLDWSGFNSLPGDKSKNFERLCHQLIRLHFGCYGKFKALANQPGVEFHLQLTAESPLGNPPRWFGWQCKFHNRNQNGTLKSSSRNSIQSSLESTKKVLPEITDWILWTPYTLSQSDQDWYYNLDDHLNLHLWTDIELDSYLSGPGLHLRYTNFGELALTPNLLEEMHCVAVKPIQNRWLQPLHQRTNAEKEIRQMLGEPKSWDEMIEICKDLQQNSTIIETKLKKCTSDLAKKILPFLKVCNEFEEMLLRIHKMLSRGVFENIFNSLEEQRTKIDYEMRSIPRLLHRINHPLALDVTNALDDIRKAQFLLDKVAGNLEVGLVAVLAEAGGGKTQLSAEITAPQNGRPAGIFLQGQNFRSNDSLDDLAKHYSTSNIRFHRMEDMLAALDAAGKRASQRLPILIDGLNEAESPKTWRVELARLSEQIKKYPNVLVVCTLRTGEHRTHAGTRRPKYIAEQREVFAKMSLPDDVKRIYSEGFRENAICVIKRYLEYYKIKPDGARIPVEFLKHPLNLRIYCEVTNPKRESNIPVVSFPVSLTLLFDRYLSNACERIVEMTNLSHSYNADELKLVIYKLGIELWETGRRQIIEVNFRNLVGDLGREWDSSIVNLLAQEGIIFRNPSQNPEQLTVSAVYDALGGHVIASALLAKNAQDYNFDWLNERENMNMFLGEDNHELASNIFNSLVALTPIRMRGQQLWEVAPDSMKRDCLMFTTQTEAKYIDEDTVAALTRLFMNESDARVDLFTKIKRIRSIADHPLNANFLDNLLRKISIADRDLSWTEWVRNNPSPMLEGILRLEEKWKILPFSRTSADLLRAKWTKWYLTSTIRQFRDIATRALYWYGRGCPEELFAETVKSLEIDDPYVSERMLAASYGVAMANRTDSDSPNFVGTILSKYARKLYDNIFAVEARFGTTHILAREYAYRTIEMASLHNENLFAIEELKNSNPPFSHGGLRDWGKVDEEFKLRRYDDSPFEMDFENYTIGSLVPNRANYDYTQQEYRKVRAQIFWRVNQLGWSGEKFGEIDNRIASSRYYRHEKEAAKIERYGKKYSWIAYFEMSGLLNDLEVIEEHYERTSCVDIDPSFPEQVTESRVFDTDYLGNQKTNTNHWMTLGCPDIKPFLRLGDLKCKLGPWVLLDGSLSQEDKNLGRHLFWFVQAYFVKKIDAESIINHLSTMFPAGRRLPRKPTVSLTFAGEIPWCSSFPLNGKRNLKIEVDKVPVTKEKIEYQIFLDGKKLNISIFDLNDLRWYSSSHDDWKNDLQLSDEDLKRIEVREVSVIVEEMLPQFEEYEVIVPVCDYYWSDSKTVTNEGTLATVLSKEISSELSLITRPQCFDSFTPDGRQATYNISDHSLQLRNNQSVFYIREDLLRIYLNQNDLTLIWAIWGERSFSSNFMMNFAGKSDSNNLGYATFSTVEHYNGF